MPRTLGMSVADSERRRDLIMELLTEGTSAREIADRLGVCLDTVYKTRRDRSEAEPMSTSERQERRERIAVRVLVEGWSVAFVARDEGVSERTVERACRSVADQP